MSDTFTLTAAVELSDAQRAVDQFVADAEARNFEMAASVAEVDTSEVDTAVERIEGEAPELGKPTVPAPDTSGFKAGLDDMDARSDQSRSVLANLTGNVAQDAFANLGGVAGSTGVAIGQLAEYATDGNIAIQGLLKAAGPMLALTLAVEVGTRAWAAYTAKTKMTEQTTKAVNEALTSQSGALAEVTSALDDLIESGTATGWDRLNAALAEGLDEGELKKITGALGDLGMTFEDLSPTLAAIEADTGDVQTAMQSLAETAGIPPEYVDNVAAAVHAGEDFGEISSELQRSLQDEGMSFEDAAAAADELTSAYEPQIRAMEQLNDAQQNSDLQKIAEDQLEVAKGASVASAAMVEAAEAAAGPDATALAVWNEYIRLQNEATAAAEAQAEAAKLAEEAAAGAQALADAMQSAAWGRADVEGATSAMSQYTEAMFAAGNQQQALNEAVGGLGAALADQALSFDVNTASGAAQQDAIEELARVVDSDLVEAYEAAGGSFDEFAKGAEQVRSDVVQKLQDDLGITADEANAVADAIGLTEGDYQARFELAGAAEAQLQLDLLSEAIAGLPPEVETTVNQQILAGDYVLARDTVQQYYDDNPVEQPVEANTVPFIDTVSLLTGIAADTPVEVPAGMDTSTAERQLAAMKEEAEDEPVEVEAEADTADADEELDETAEERTAPIEADASTGEATGDLDDAADDRSTDITAIAVTAGAATDLLRTTSQTRVADIVARALTRRASEELNALDQTRTAPIKAIALTASAEAELNHTARTRTSYIRQVRIGGGGGSGGGNSRAAAAPASAAPVFAPHVVINTAVIGDRYDVQRVVARAVRSSLRLSGARP